MKILKIEKGNGFFLSLSDDKWRPIDEIDKNGLLGLLNKFLEETVEMDGITDDNLQNQAHLIIYKSIHEKFLTLLGTKAKFKDESARMFLEEIKKYENS